MPARRNGRSRSFRSAGSTTRRQTEWIGGCQGLFDLADNTRVVVLAFSQAALADLVPFTIIRTIGQWTTAIDAGFVTDQDYNVGLGGTVMLEQSRATPVVPSPIINIADDNWFLYDTSTAVLEEVLTSNAAVMVSQTRPLDSRAQRKVQDGDSIVFAAENNGVDTARVALTLRILCKLH